MSSKFLESFLSAGVGGELKPERVKKNLLCGVKDLVVVKGDIADLKLRLASTGDDPLLKWTRFLVLSEEKKMYLAIRYSNPFKADDNDFAVYDIELLRVAKTVPSNEVVPTKGEIIKTIDALSIQTYVDIFR